MSQTCDFCQAAFDWTPDQVAMDLSLRLMGSGLGACCPDCDEKQVQIAMKEYRRDMRRERDHARRERLAHGGR